MTGPALYSPDNPFAPKVSAGDSGYSPDNPFAPKTAPLGPLGRLRVPGVSAEATRVTPGAGAGARPSVGQRLIEAPFRMLEGGPMTAVQMATAPLAAGAKGAAFMGQSAAETSLPADIRARALADPDRIPETEAGLAAAQLAVLPLAGPLSKMVSEPIAAALSKYAVTPGTAIAAGRLARAAGAATSGGLAGAAYVPEDPVVGGVIGAALGGVHGYIAPGAPVPMQQPVEPVPVERQLGNGQPVNRGPIASATARVASDAVPATGTAEADYSVVQNEPTPQQPAQRLLPRLRRPGAGQPPAEVGAPPIAGGSMLDPQQGPLMTRAQIEARDAAVREAAGKPTVATPDVPAAPPTPATVPVAATAPATPAMPAAGSGWYDDLDEAPKTAPVVDPASLRDETGKVRAKYRASLRKLPDQHLDTEIARLGEELGTAEATGGHLTDDPGYRGPLGELPDAERLGKKVTAKDRANGNFDLPDADGMVDPDRLQADNAALADYRKSTMARAAKGKLLDRLYQERENRDAPQRIADLRRQLDEARRGQPAETADDDFDWSTGESKVPSVSEPRRPYKASQTPSLFGGTDLFGRPVSMAETDVGTGKRGRSAADIEKAAAAAQAGSAITPDEMAARREELGAPKSEAEATATKDQTSLFERASDYQASDRSTFRLPSHMHDGYEPGTTDGEILMEELTSGAIWDRTMTQPMMDAQDALAPFVDEFLHSGKPVGALHAAAQKYADQELHGSAKRAFMDSVKNFRDKVQGSVSEPVRAYHGSPHDFDRFSLEHIGSGEGAQSYGWGLYFAGKKEIAQHYRDKLTRNAYPNMEQLRSYYTPGAVVKGYSGYERVIRFHEKDGEWTGVEARSVVPVPLSDSRPSEGDITAAQRRAFGFKDNYTHPVGMAKWVDVPGERNRVHHSAPSLGDVEALLGPQKSGHMYKVKLPDEKDFLDWDKPIGKEMAKRLQPLADESKGLLGAGIDRSGFGDTEYHSVVRWEPGPTSPMSDIAKVKNEYDLANRAFLASTSSDSPERRAAVKAQYEDAERQMLDTFRRAQDTSGRWVIHPEATGRELYHVLANYLADHRTFGSGSTMWSADVPSDERASKALNALGIAGMKYSDASARGNKVAVRAVTVNGKKQWEVNPKWSAPNQVKYFDSKEQANDYADTFDSKNYVVYDDKTINVLEKGHQVSEITPAQIDMFAAGKNDPASVKLTFGSEANRKAAVTQVIKQAGDWAVVYDAERPSVATRESVLPGPHTGAMVNLVGKQVNSVLGGVDLGKLHKALVVVRSPIQEHFGIIVTDDKGTVVHHTHTSSGAITYNVVMSPRQLETALEQAVAAGGTRVFQYHNHPSGEVEPSGNDLVLTSVIDYQIDEINKRRGWNIRNGGHYVIDHGKGTFLEHLGGGEIRKTTVELPKDAAMGPDWAGAHGAKINSVDELGKLVRQADPETHVGIGYVAINHAILAYEPHAPSVLSDLSWLTGRMKELGSPFVFVVAPEQVADLAVQEIARQGLDDAVRDVAAVRRNTDGSIQVASAVGTGKRFAGEGIESEGDSAPPRILHTATADPAGGAPPVRGAKASLRLRVPGQVGEPRTPYGKDAEKPLTPGVSPMGEATGIAGAFRALVAPTTVSPLSDRMGQIVRAVRGESLDRAAAISRAALQKFAAKIGRAPTGAQLDFIYRVEAGVPQANTQWQPLANAIRTALDKKRDEVRALGTGKLENFIKNYFPHIWKDPAKAQSVIGRIMGKRPLAGPKSFLKHRTIPTTREGIELGLEPVTTNPIELALLKLHEMDRYLFKERLLEALKKEGLAKFAPGRVPDGWARINDEGFTVYGPKSGAVKLPDEANIEPEDVEVAGRRIMGFWVAPIDAARVLNNYLSPGLRGNPIYDAWMGVGNTMNQAQLGIGFFHAGFTTVDQAVSRTSLGVGALLRGHPLTAAGDLATTFTAPLTQFHKGSKLIREYNAPGSVGGIYADVAKLAAQAGGRFRFEFSRQASKEFEIALRGGHYGTAARKLLPTLIEQLARPVMEELVPRQKAAIFMDLARRELEALPATATEADRIKAVQRAWDSVDNRLGQVVYPNIFWNPVFKDLLHASVRSVGWNWGSFRELGGGAADIATLLKDAASGKKPDVTPRIQYLIALPITLGMLGAVINFLYTGEAPKDLRDLYHPRDGTFDSSGNANRIQLPSYMKDIFAFSKHSVQTIMNKAHPLLSTVADMLQNEDYYGNMIRNPDAPLVRQMMQLAEFAGKNMMPFSVSNMQEGRRRGETGAKVVLPFIGVMPANRTDVRSDAQNKMMEYLKRRGQSSLTPEQVDASDKRRAATKALRQGDPSALRGLAQTGALSRAQVQYAYRALGKNALISSFQRLTLPEAETVYQMGTPEEQQLWHGALALKRARGARNGVVPSTPYSSENPFAKQP